MNRKYSKDNPLPKAELSRLQRNTQRRIRSRSKAQIAPETLEQFKHILFQTINSKNKALTSAELKALDSAITERIKDLVSSENDARSEAANKLKDLFAEYGMSKRDLLEAVKQTKWAKLSDEILKLEIQKGVDEIEAGYGIILETKTDLENFFEKIRQRCLRKQKAKQKAGNNFIQP